MSTQAREMSSLARYEVRPTMPATMREAWKTRLYSSDPMPTTRRSYAPTMRERAEPSDKNEDLQQLDTSATGLMSRRREDVGVAEAHKAGDEPVQR